jgi:RNA polymerase sigma factor (sigma-70 family)
MPGRTRDQTSNQSSDFAEFVREHHAAISRHVARVYGDQENDSVVAAVFAVAWQRFDEIPKHRADEWLKGVARHVVLNTRRGDARWVALQRAAQATTEAESAPVDDDRRLEAKVVAAGLGSLSLDDQSLLRLQAAEEPSSDELAAILGISPQAARTRLSRARQRLHDACEQLQADVEAGS